MIAIIFPPAPHSSSESGTDSNLFRAANTVVPCRIEHKTCESFLMVTVTNYVIRSNHYTDFVANYSLVEESMVSNYIVG